MEEVKENTNNIGIMTEMIHDGRESRNLKTKIIGETAAKQAAQTIISNGTERYKILGKKEKR